MGQDFCTQRLAALGTPDKRKAPPMIPTMRIKITNTVPPPAINAANAAFTAWDPLLPWLLSLLLLFVLSLDFAWLSGQIAWRPFRFPGCPHGLECLLFCKIAWVFTFWEETGEAFTIRGAVFTVRFPASLTVFSASGLILMLLPAPVRPFFVLVCPDVPPLPVSLSNVAITASLCLCSFYLLISFHCQLLSTMIGDRSAFLSSPLFRPFYPVSSVFHRRFLSGFSSHLVCHHPGLLFRFQHGRTHQFFGKPGRQDCGSSGSYPVPSL